MKPARMERAVRVGMKAGKKIEEGPLTSLDWLPKGQPLGRAP